MLAAATVGTLACAGLVACAPAPSGPPVAVLFPGDTDDAWGASAEVLRQELADDGYAVEVHFAGDDIPTQLEQLRDVLEAAPVAVVIAPVDATAIAAVLDEEVAPEVAVIAYDELILDSAQVDYFATFDHRAAGRLRAEALVTALGLAEHPDAEDPDAEAAPVEPPPVELLAGSGDDRGAQDAFAGALEVLQPYLDAGRLVVPSGRVTIEQAAVLRGDPATAAERVAELLDGDVELAGVLSPSDAMSAAIAEVLAEHEFGIVPAGERWSAAPVPPDGEPSAPPSATPPPPDATTPPNTDAQPDGSAEPDAEPDGSAEADTEPDPAFASVVLTGGGSSLAGARAMRDGTQTSTVYEDSRELARAVASMVREVVNGSAPTVTQGATTDNGMREVPTRLLEPRLVATRDEATALLG
jgi:putative multiple sugar transport system substrate-binding protein